MAHAGWGGIDHIVSDKKEGKVIETKIHYSKKKTMNPTFYLLVGILTSTT
jgi:hypothetical protein